MRFFATLRMTGSEGFRGRMIRGEGFRALAHWDDAPYVIARSGSDEAISRPAGIATLRSQ